MQKNIARFCYLLSSNIHLLLVNILCVTSLITHPMGGMGQFPGMPNLTPEEMQALEQELAQAAQAIEQHVNSLSPEEQAEFHRAVSELEQMMSTMSEEELNQFFETVIAQEMANAQEVPGQVPAAVTGAPIVPKETPTPKEEPKFTSEQQKALTILTSIIELIDSFMVKMQNVPDINSKFTQWLSQGKLPSVDRALDWDLFKKTIELFKKDISDMRKIDQKTKKYVFLDALIKNDQLYRTLTHLESQLKTYEPRVSVVSFGIERLSSETKSAIQKIMSALASSIQTSNPEIKKLFETYEPEAAKIKEEEKKQLEKAKAESAQQRRPAPATGITTGGMYGAPGYKPTTPGTGYGDYYGYPSGGYYGEPSHAYGQPTATPTPTKEPSRPGAPSASKEQKELKLPGKDDKKKKKEEEEKKKQDEAQKKAEEQKAKGKALTIPRKKEEKKEKLSPVCPINSDSPEGILDLINNNLDFTDILIEESAGLLSDIRATITSAGKPDNQLTIVTIPRLVRRVQNLQDLVTKYIDKISGIIQGKVGTKETATDIKPQLAALYGQMQKHPLFASILPQLDALIVQLSKDDTLLMAIPADKRYAYFANKLKPKDATTQLDAPSESMMKEYNQDTIGSLLDLHKQLDAIRTKLGGSVLSMPTQEAPTPASMQVVEPETELE